MKLLQNFPIGYKPNSQQEKLLTEIENAFNEGYKFVVCSAPTGTGKSFISKTLANVSGQPSKDYTDLIYSYNAYKRNAFNYDYEDECNNEPAFGAFALTITKSLQDQYQELFNEIKVLKGKNNYQCNIATEHTADYAPCLYSKQIKENCWSKNCCTYYNTRNEALASNFAALNYKMFFSLPDHVKRRKYLVCDEASELEEELVKEFSCVIETDILERHGVASSYPKVSNYAKMQVWVTELAAEVTRVSKSVEEALPSFKQHPTMLEREKERYIFLRSLLSKLQLLQDTWHFCEYIIEKKEDKICFTPLKVDKLSNKIFNMGEKIVLLSATIIDHKTFCKTIGITNYKYIEVDSTFDSKKSPIYVASKFKLNAQNLQSKLPNIASIVNKICNHHKSEKGVIHTHTNDITNYLKTNLDGDRYLFREKGVTNEDILQLHKDNESPTVLISPSLVYGVDLKDELARFQIIIKAPYAPLLDQRIKKLFQINPQWYVNKMLTSVIQMCGRGVRSNKDYCKTYIIDGNIADTVIRNVSILPKHFINRFV